MNPVPPTVFISYSHEDEDWKDLLVTHLAGLERAGRLRVWEDRAIRAGQIWRQEIETAMEEARVAVLLVSPNFLASDFIQAQELPRLLERRMEGGMHIVPVIVRDCLWEEEVRIANLQARPLDGRALASFRSDRRHTEVKKIAKEILELLGEKSSPVQVFQIGQVLEPADRPAGRDSNPYRGLAAFREEDADRFFGREKLTEELWEKLQALQETRGTEGAVRLLAVVGPSGSGKSSLVRAGLLPELARRPLAGLENLRVAIVTPGAHPVETLALVLARLVTGDPDPVAKARELSGELTQRNSAGKLDGLRRIAGDKPLLVFVDQFEEAYTLAAAEERAVFVANLLEAAADRGGTVLVLLGLRNDFMGDTRRDEALHQIVARQNLFARYLGEDELRRAIAEPARRAGRPLDEGTIGHLVEATHNEEQALPALQFTLSQVWEGMGKGVSPARTYEIIGGIAGSFAKEAQRLYDALPETDRRIAHRAFLRMVRVGPDIPDTARKVDLDEVVAWDEDRDHVKAVLERFARPEARIITLASEPDNRITARLTHEALLDRWRQVDEWLTPQVREDLLFHYRLEEEARYWDRRGRSSELLWPSHDLERLRAYERRGGGDMTDVQRAFFEASYPKDAKRPGPALWKSPALLGVLAAILALVAVGLWQYSRGLLQGMKALSAPSDVSVIDVPSPRIRGAGEPDIVLPLDKAVLLDLSYVSDDSSLPGKSILLLSIEELDRGSIFEGDVRTSTDGTLLVALPRELQKLGKYRLNLSTRAEHGSTTLASFAYSVRPPSWRDRLTLR